MRVIRLSIGLFFSTALLCPAEAAQPAPIPDLSGNWGRNWVAFEPKPGEPVPVGSKNVRADGTMESITIGDDSSPLITPRAAEAIRKRAEISRNASAPDPHNQCAPEPTPFSFTTEFGLRILQKKDEVLLIWLANQQVRHVKMNVPHPAIVARTWQGDSVGHYEWDTLVIDTVGQGVGPLSMVDLYGTPFSESLHVIERYRLIDGAAARDAQQKNEARYFPPGVSSPLTNEYGRGSIDTDISKPGLQVEIAVEDPVMFTQPWSAVITYSHVVGDWPEAVCAENAHEYYANRDTPIPRADKPDF